MEKEPRESQTLLLPARQDLIPRPFLIEAPGEMTEFDFLQDFRGLRHASAMGCVRIVHGPSKRTHRHIWPLRQNQELPPGCDLDVASTPRPHACEGARENALAGSRVASQQHLFTRPDGNVRALDHCCPVVERDRDIAQPQCRVFPPATSDPTTVADFRTL